MGSHTREGDWQTRLWSTLRHAFALGDGAALTERERLLLDRLAREVVKRRMVAPALFLLESGKPLSYLASQVVTFFKPVITAIFSPGQCETVASLLARRRSLEQLLRMIERYDRQGSRNGAQGPDESPGGEGGSG